MIQRLSLKTSAIALFVAALAAFAVAVPSSAYADTIDHSVKCGVGFKFDGKDCATTEASCLKNGGTQAECAKIGDPSGSLENLIEKIVNILSVIVGVVAVIMIIIGGFKYITSGGDSNRVASAKNTIIYAIVGLIIVALSQVIARFVVGNVT